MKSLQNKEEISDSAYSRVVAILSLFSANPLLLEKSYHKDLVNLVIEKFGIKERQARKYINLARKEWNNRSKDDLEKWRNKILNQFEDVVRRAKLKKNLHAEIRALREQAIVAGVYEEKSKVQSEITITRRIIDTRNELRD